MSDNETDRKTILLVDDDSIVRESVAEMLDTLGYRVLEASDGRAALDVLHGDSHIDLLLTDVVMPGGMGGQQLAEEARRIRPGLPVLLASGYAKGLVERGDATGTADNLLFKPFRMNQLETKIGETLAGASG